MGYYANGSGGITFKEVLPEETYKKIENMLLETFETDGCRTFKATKMSDAKSYFDIWNNEKYYGDAVEATLNDVAAVAPIENGEICYHGEDDSIWRFKFKDGKWIEQNGEVNYTGIDAEKLFSALRSYVLNDLEAAEHTYVYNTLKAYGLDDNDITELGFGNLKGGNAK